MDCREKALEIIRNKTALVISGGGTLGLGEIGSLERVEQLGLPLKNFKSVSGSSIGSILGTAVACGADSAYMKKVLESLNLENFKDRDCFLRSAFQLVTKYGLNETDEVRKLASKVLTDLIGNPNITFKELYDLTGVHLTITYLSLNYERTMYADHLTEPDSLVRETMVKSSSIPLFYEAYFDGKGKDKFVDCDGGTANNYPMNVPRNQKIDPEKIIGLKLLAPKDFNTVDNGGSGLPLKNHGPPCNVIEYLYKIVAILRNQAMRIHVNEDDWKLSVKIDIGNLTSTDFGITKEEQKWLYQQGIKAVDKYVDELEILLKEGKFIF